MDSCRAEEDPSLLLQRSVDCLSLVMRWTVENLEKFFGDVSFSVEQSYGGSVEMQLKNFLEYIAIQHDEDPLYLFDADFALKAKAFADDYSLPSIFDDDLLPFLDSDAQRPEYRWLLIGPSRSGSSWHIDPWGSSAWNLLISGRKRWALYPPERLPPGLMLMVDDSGQDMHFDTCTALRWFLEVLPDLKEQDRPYEFVQEAGETVFIPYGWWHCVLNLETTVSVKSRWQEHIQWVDQVTQNFVSTVNLPDTIHLLSRGAGAYYSRLYPFRSHHQPKKDPLPNLSCRWIGALVRALWLKRPEMIEQLWMTSKEHMHVEELERCLKAICIQHQLPCPAKHEIFPMRATSNFIFKIDAYMIKIFFHRNPLNLCIQCVAESKALMVIEESGDTSSSSSFVGSGIVNFHGDCIIEAPYIISAFQQGRQLSDVFDEINIDDKDQMAITLGHQVARFHAIHLPFSTQKPIPSLETFPVISTSASSEMQSLSNEGCRCNCLIAFEGLRLAMQWLESNVTSRGTFFQAQDPDRVWSQSLDGMISAIPPPDDDDDHNPRIPGIVHFKVDQNQKTICGAWYPFFAFIDWRLRVVRHMPSETNLPEHLLPDVNSYLPDDAESLLSWTKNDNGTVPVPSYLHGDLTDDNILISFSTRRVSPCIVDFGDTSHGDPLYDFVALYLSSLGSNPALLGAFIHSYVATSQQIDPDRWTLWKTSRLHRPSYYAMCYTLLHEDDTLGWLLESQPHHRHITSLHQLEVTLWGSLNDALSEYCFPSEDKNCSN